MRDKISKLLQAVVALVKQYPGSIGFVLGELALLLAKVGLNVSTATLYAIGAVVVPLVLSYFHVSSRAKRRAAYQLGHDTAKAEWGLDG